LLGEVPAFPRAALRRLHDIAAMRPETLEPDRRSATRPGPMRILLVHRRPQPELVRLLAREGHDVLAVEESQRALRFLGVFKPEVILIATTEPAATCSALRRAAPETAMLVLLPFQDLERRIAALDAGADDCLGTPYHPKELAARMHAMTRRRLRTTASAHPQQESLASG
jgi:DNA-binding response OmpR family regulator